MSPKRPLILITVQLCLVAVACGGEPAVSTDHETVSSTESAPTAKPQPTQAPMYIKADEICGLLSQEEAEELLGKPLTKPPQPSEAMCSYWAKGGGFRIENLPRPSPVLKGYNGAAFANKIAEWLVSVGSEGTMLDGIADGAVQTSAFDNYTVFVVRGPHLFRIQATGEIDDETAEQLAAVAATIGPRLYGLNGHVR